MSNRKRPHCQSCQDRTVQKVVDNLMALLIICLTGAAAVLMMQEHRRAQEARLATTKATLERVSILCGAHEVVPVDDKWMCRRPDGLIYIAETRPLIEPTKDPDRVMPVPYPPGIISQKSPHFQ